MNNDLYPFPPPPPSLDERIAALELLASGQGPGSIEDARAAINPHTTWAAIAAPATVATPASPSQPVTAAIKVSK